MAVENNVKHQSVRANETISLPQDAGASPNITSITSKKSESTAFNTTLRQAGNWKVVGSTVYFFKAQFNVIITYEIQLTDEQAEKLYGKITWIILQLLEDRWLLVLKVYNLIR